MEHWLPLFHDHLDTLFDFVPDALVLLAHQSEEAKTARLELIADYYATRKDMLHAKDDDAKHAIKAPPYKPLPPDALYLTDEEWKNALKRLLVRDLSPFQAPESTKSVDAGGKAARDFAPERSRAAPMCSKPRPSTSRRCRPIGKRVLVASWSEGSAERMGGVLADHGLDAIRRVSDWPDARKLHKGAAGISVLWLRARLRGAGLRHRRRAGHPRRPHGAPDAPAPRAELPARKRRASRPAISSPISSTASAAISGLKTIDAAGAPHDCLELQYDGGKLFLPVENIELLTRYGADEGTCPARPSRRRGLADAQGAHEGARARDGGGADPHRRRARAEIARRPSIRPPGIYDEFCARFPYQETEDQEKAIADVIEDLGKGRPMDRLVCGDVGFGKTEVALRAAFVMAMSGQQVAVVVPTTLLARQHFRTFAERFAGFPVKVRQLSRFVDAKEASETKAALESGDIDIVVGTHALLAKSIVFRNLGLVIVDEEQHFGVGHKERLKALKADVHVLTLTATPIPRTLAACALGRARSVADHHAADRPPRGAHLRDAVRSAGRARGAAARALSRRAELLCRAAHRRSARGGGIPESHRAGSEDRRSAHGQMAAHALEDVMTAFYDRKRRRAGLHQHRGERPRYSDRQHA